MLKENKLICAIHKGIVKGLNEYELVNEGKIKNAALGLAMLGSVAGGMSSCSNMNPALDPNNKIEYTDKYHLDFSGRPWAFEGYIGKTIEAHYLVIEDHYRIRKLVIDLSNPDEYKTDDFMYYADWLSCSWGIFFQKTEKRDNYLVDIYFSHGAPLIDEPWDEIYLDGSAYFEVWYLDDENKSREENIQFIKIYRNEEQKRETLWKVTVDNIKGTNHLDINNNGANNKPY